MDHKMDGSSKEALMIEAPPDYTESPKISTPSCKKLFGLAMGLVGVVLAVLAVLLVGLHITEKHTEAVLQMTIQGLEKKGGSQHLSMSQKERLAIFPVHVKFNSSATVIYDFSNLLIGYRSWPGQSCYVTRMNRKEIQSLDAVVKVFQHAQETPSLLAPKHSQKLTGEASTVPADRTALGAPINLLCSSIPIYWV